MWICNGRRPYGNGICRCVKLLKHVLRPYLRENSVSKSELVGLFFLLNLHRDSHARAHLRMRACHTVLRYAWQKPPHAFDEDDSLPKKMGKELLENLEPQKKNR